MRDRSHRTPSRPLSLVLALSLSDSGEEEGEWGVRRGLCVADQLTPESGITNRNLNMDYG